VRVAPLIGAYPSHLALLSGFVDGDDRFPRASQPAALARDFVAQLAALHAIDAGHPALAALGDAAQAPSARIAERLAQLRALHLSARPDPILQLALDWLAAHVPPDDGPSVVVHGDAGPGNFLYRDAAVTALVDWELTHLGDPAEDLAQIAVRSLIQPFVPMRDALAAYAQASGRSIDPARLKFHRLYFQMGFLVPGHVAAQRRGTGGGGGGGGGAAMMYTTMHRRVIVESLAERMGVALEAVALPDGPPTAIDGDFAEALADLKDEIVPRLADQRASAKAKSLARLIKYWRMRDRFGAACEAAERAELCAALGTGDAPLADLRVALAHAVADRRIDAARALRLCHARMARDTFLMADAMGALATTTYEPLDD